jgi:hypothetical protein
LADIFVGKGGVMLKQMKAHSHLKPGQKGTLRLVEKYGDALLCVRYRYDELRDVRLKTVEIIVEERPGKAAPRLRDSDPVIVQVPFTMPELRERLKSVGARWDVNEKVWRVRYGLIRGDEELEERIVG